MRVAWLLAALLAGCSAPAPAPDGGQTEIAEPARRGMDGPQDTWWNGTLLFQANQVRTPIISFGWSGLLALTPGNCAIFDAQRIHEGTAVATWGPGPFELELAVAGDTTHRVAGASPLHMDLAGIEGGQLRMLVQGPQPGLVAAQDVRVEVTMHRAGSGEPQSGTCTA